MGRGQVYNSLCDMDEALRECTMHMHEEVGQVLLRLPPRPAPPRAPSATAAKAWRGGAAAAVCC